MSLLEINNLALGYDGEVIIDNLSFKVNRGDYLCIVGENGSGKSTLMKTLLNLNSPMNGSIIYGDGLHKNENGYLPQQTVVQRDFPASVKEIVLSGCQARCGLRPFYSKADKQLAMDNMKRLGISDLSSKSYRDLSGGQQQRVLLARALCATKTVLLLDEPVSGLDPIVTADMYSLIKGMNNDGITIIMVSHDISAAVQYATHILHIGEKVFFGTKEQYLKSDMGKIFTSESKGENNV